MFYITTPIYYVNDEPHLGHAYTTVLADVLARYHRLMGEEVFLLTGVDEHGQKVYNAVRKNNIVDPNEYVDQMALRFQNAWRRLDINYDDFIRTTEPRHKRVVTTVLQRLWDAGEIYRGDYEGWYCIPDERFWTEKDLAAGDDGVQLCPDCNRPVEKIVETNYFFRMSHYQDWLIETIQANPEFIQPVYRRNEVLGFLRQPLGDLCISRPRSRLNWGIPLPFDEDYVTYVWFDALLNYVTAAGYLVDNERFNHQWPFALHLIGKDILTTHSVYWPTMLKAAGLPLPKTIFAHGWWSIGGFKMSKSLGNAVKPLDLADTFGIDAFRYILMREMTPGQDAEFSTDRIASRYVVDLANNIGNLLQRVTNMASRYLSGQLLSSVVLQSISIDMPGSGSQPVALLDDCIAVRKQVEGLPASVFARVESYEVNVAAGLCMDVLAYVNGFLERSAPWSLAKAGQTNQIGLVLSTAAEALRIVSVLLSPILPGKSAEILHRLGYIDPAESSQCLNWGQAVQNAPVEMGEPLFPRIG